MSSLVNRSKFHITIGTVTEVTSDGKVAINLDNEFRLIKAALLYADCVKLCSLKTSMVDYLVSLPNKSFREQVEYMEIMIPRVAGLPEAHAKEIEFWLLLIKQYKKTFNIKHPKRDVLLLRLRLESLIKTKMSGEFWKWFSEAIAQKAGTNVIKSLMDSGLMEYHPLDLNLKEEKLERQFMEFCKFVGEAITDGSTYPLFDDLTGELVKESISEGKMKISGVGTKRIKQTQLAALLLERLPLFDAASVDEILDIRKELERPLVRFRAAIINFSDEIKSEPWDKDFSCDAEQVFYKEVEPAILEIEDEVRSNSYLASLLRKVADKPLTIPIGSTLAIAMSQLSSLPNIVSQALGIGLSAAPLVYDATKEWKEKHIKIEQNHLFFYYRAKKELTD